MPRLTPERECEIRWSLANLGPFGSGPALEDLLDEVDALRVDSTFLNEAVIEACADRDYFARLVERLEEKNALLATLVPGPVQTVAEANRELVSLREQVERLELALTDARSDLESFMEHHKATEAQNARLRAASANRLPISKSVTRRLDAQGVTGKVGKITKAEPR